MQGQPTQWSLPHITLQGLTYGNPNGHPVLAIHGWLDNAASFSRLAPHLNDLYIVAIDLPGHGYSDHRPLGSHYHLVDYVADIQALLDHLGWTHCQLLGHSLGAVIALLAAAGMPERIQQLLLIDGLLPLTTPSTQVVEQLRQGLRQTKRAPSSSRGYSSWVHAVQQRMNAHYPVTADAAERLLRRNLQLVDQRWTWRTDPRTRRPSLLRFTPEQAEAILAAVECPIHAVFAEQGFAPKIRQAGLNAPQLHITYLDGGHHLHLDSEAGAQAVAHIFNAAQG